MLNGNISVSKVHKNKLKRYKRILRFISDKKRSANAKKKVIVQTAGSFLLSLIPAAISTIISLLLFRNEGKFPKNETFSFLNGEFSTNYFT